MVKDYAKKAVHDPHQKKRNVLVIIIIMAIVMLLPLVGFYFRYQSHKQHWRKKQQPVSGLQAVNKKSPAKIKKQTPKFEFYTALPKIKVPAEENTQQKS